MSIRKSLSRWLQFCDHSVTRADVRLSVGSFADRQLDDQSKNELGLLPIRRMGALTLTSILDSGRVRLGRFL